MCCNLKFGLVTKARACKGTSQGWVPKVTFCVLGNVGKCEGMNLHIPKWALTLRIRVRNHPRFIYMQVDCHIPLESSQRGLQLFFRPHLNRRSLHKIMGPQSHESPNLENFETLNLGVWNKMTFGCWRMAKQKEYYNGEGGGFPKFRLWWILWIRVYPWLVHAPKVFQLCTNQLVVWFV
jgi:hypothetical protein